MLPWGYKRAFICCALLFLLGTVFQLLWGGIPPRLLQYPWSAVAALVYTYGLVLIFTLSDRFPRLRRLYDRYAVGIHNPATHLLRIHPVKTVGTAA